MKVDLGLGTRRKEIVYPDDVIFVGLSSVSICNGMNIAKYLEYYGNITVTKEKLDLPDGKDATILVYRSDDEKLRQIMNKYRGLAILEFHCDDVDIVATL